MSLSKRIHPYTHPKMLKDFLREDLSPCSPPNNSSVWPSLETILVKDFKVMLRSRWASFSRRTSREVCKGKGRAKTSVLKIKDIMRGMFFGEEFSPTWWEFAAEKCAGVPACPIIRPIGVEETTRSFFMMEQEDKERQDSPVSVISFWFGDYEKVYAEDCSREVDEQSSDDIQDRGRRLVSHIKLDSNLNVSEPHRKKLLRDFFGSELSCESTSDILERKAVDPAASRIEGELYRVNELGIGGRKDVYITEMDVVGAWSGFGELEEEVVLEVVGKVLEGLIKELLVDCLPH